jgi:hypothetical protein
MTTQNGLEYKNAFMDYFYKFVEQLKKTLFAKETG